MMSTSQKAFLSHKSSDKPAIDVVGQALLSSGVDVFYDKWDIAGGESIPAEIEKALADSNIFIYALSPAAVESKWVGAEYHAFLYRKLNDQSLRIIPLLLADCNKPAFVAPLKHIDFRNFDPAKPATHSGPIEELLRSIFRSSKKPPMGMPHPALASYELYFQKMKTPPPGGADDHWELGFKNVTDLPLQNFVFAVEFRQPVESVRYDFARSTANMTGGEGTSADKRFFHWLGNQIMDDGGWVVFVIKSNTPPSIKRLCTKLLGRSSDMRMLFPPDPVGLQELATAIKAG